MIAACAGLWVFGRAGEGEMPQQQNPAELKSALVFGALYALVIVATAAARDHFGDDAIYAVAVISGVVDVDAITLSTARLGAAQRLDTATVTNVVLLASLSNIVFKAGAVMALGSVALFLRLAPLLLLALGAGAGLILLWPF
jgi:uncharacterized membrane protein (DUF4010 family)